MVMLFHERYIVIPLSNPFRNLSRDMIAYLAIIALKFGVAPASVLQ